MKIQAQVHKSIIFTMQNDIINIESNNYGHLHNLKGPAIIWKSGVLGYYIDGEWIGNNLSNRAFQNAIKELVFA